MIEVIFKVPNYYAFLTTFTQQLIAAPGYPVPAVTVFSLGLMKLMSEI